MAAEKIQISDLNSTSKNTPIKKKVAFFLMYTKNTTLPNYLRNLHKKISRLKKYIQNSGWLSYKIL